jgi:hypothetical protein
MHVRKLHHAGGKVRRGWEELRGGDDLNSILERGLELAGPVLRAGFCSGGGLGPLLALLDLLQDCRNVLDWS